MRTALSPSLDMYEKTTGKLPTTERPRPRPRSGVKRTTIAVVFSLLFLGSLFHPTPRLYHPACHAYSRMRPQTVEERVYKILSETPLIDGHDDFPLMVRGLYNNHIYGKNFTKPFEEGRLPYHVDLARLRSGQNGGAFWSVYAFCPANGSDWSDENYRTAVQFTYEQIDLMNRLAAAYPDDFSDVAGISSASAIAAFKEGKLISPLGVEGLHQIGNSIATLRHFHALGARYVTLTHNCRNIYADSAIISGPSGHSIKAPPYWGGLSPRGKQLIHEMNRIGLIVDLAHVSVDTMIDVLGGREFEGSKAPIMFSHSSAYSLCPHPRNVPDDVLQLVKKTNSVVMGKYSGPFLPALPSSYIVSEQVPLGHALTRDQVNFAPDFIACKDVGNESGIPEFVPEDNTLSQVASHITHIGNLIGYDHVGLGSDFDGIPSTPEGLEDVSKYPDLIAELLRRGVSDRDAAKIVGGNILRVWKDVEDVAAKLQSEGFPILEDDVTMQQ